MSHRIQLELANIADQIEETGYVTEELKAKLQTLLSNASLLIALGPTAIVTRNNSEDDRVMPDNKDIELYSLLITNEQFGRLFDSEDWGTANISLEKVNYKDSIAPALRVYWENKVMFVKDWHNRAQFDQKLNSYLSQLELLIAPKWIEWRVELE